MSEYTQAPEQPASVVYVEQPRNGLAVAAMVLGIIAVLFVWIPFLNILSMILAIVALGLGIPALIKANRVRKGMGPAIAGIVLAVVSGIGFFAVNAATVSVVDDAVNEMNDAMDATDEISVTIGDASYDGFTTDAPVTVVNTGDETMSFMITITASSPDGSQVYDTATIFTPTLSSGQTYEEAAVFFSELPGDAVLEMTDAI